MEYKIIFLLVLTFLQFSEERRGKNGLAHNLRLLDKSLGSGFGVMCFWFNSDKYVAYDLKDLKSGTNE
ncbi:MAG: hypothetical protein MJ252_29565 [archaeon]|nr:hypothetical protein [archaeon]